MPSRLSNRNMLSPFPYLPAARTVFPCRRIGGLYEIRRAAPPIRLDGTRRHRLPHCVVPFPIGGEAQLPLLSPLPYPSNRLLAFLLASLSAGRLGVSVLSCRWTGRMRVFRVHIRFPVDSAATCDTLNRYTCGRGGTADTPDLGSGGEIRVGSNPTARTMAMHSPSPQPVQVAAGAGFFHAAETKIQSIWHRRGRNGRAVSDT